MAEELAALAEAKPSPAAYRAILEAAGEIKAVRLKVLLGRAAEALHWAKESNCGDHIESELQESIEREIA